MLPEKLVRYHLKTMTTENSDEIINIKSDDELFEPINVFLMTNTVVPINKENIVIDILDNQIIPFYGTIIGSGIIKLKNIIDGYQRYILNEDNHVKTIRLFLDTVM